MFESPLINDTTEKCVLYNRVVVSDNMGGYEEKWTEGTTFEAVIINTSSVEKEIAMKLGVTSVYNVATDKSLILRQNDYFKRLSDNKVFRVTNDGTESGSPNISPLNMRTVTAEESRLE